jgi:Predicted membrane protein (DUF2142)
VRPAIEPRTDRRDAPDTAGGTENGRARLPPRPPVRRWTWLLPGAAILAVLVAIVAVLSDSKPRLAGTNNARLDTYPVVIQPGERYCQRGERVPADASRMQLDVGTEDRPGPPLAITVGERRLSIPAGYRDGPLFVPAPGESFCVRNEGERRVYLGGQTAATALPPGVAGELGGEQQPMVARTLYWREGSESGWQIAGTVFSRWSRVTALGGATPWLAILLLLGACGAATALALRARATAALCAAVAVAAACGWAFTTPAGQVPDEPQHIAYAQYLAETGKLPRAVPGGVFSPEEGTLFAGVNFNNVTGNSTGRPPWTAAEDRAIDDALAADPGRLPDGAGTNATNNPPLYYGLEAIPYAVASGGDFLDRLLAMRILSVLLAGLAAAFAFLFLRELLPGTPWAWPAGALALAVQPLVGFITGGVNNDAGLLAAGTAILWLVARAFRRGLDRPTAIGLGAAIGLGVVTKATVAALAPGVGVALAVLLLRAAPGDERRRVLRLAGIAVAAAAAPVVVYVVLNATVWDRALWSNGVPGTESATGGKPAKLKEFLSYLWQFYLPRLPFLDDQQVGLPLFNVWFKGVVGRYGWLDTTFPEWVYTVALCVIGAVVALAGRALWRARRAVSRRRGEVLAYAALAGGLLLVIAWSGYSGRLSNGFIFEQARYLFPLAGLYAALIALAARGAGRRWGPAVGATLVVLACGHALLSVLLVVDRFYV